MSFSTYPYFVIFIKSITRLHYLCNGNFKTGSFSFFGSDLLISTSSIKTEAG